MFRASLSLAALALVGTASAQITAVFDFENFRSTAPGFGFAYPNAIVGISQGTNSANPIGFSLRRENDVPFDIVNFSDPSFGGLAPPSYGNRAIAPFGASTNPAAFLMTFTQPVSSVSLSAGDFFDPVNGDPNDTVTIEAFTEANGMGANVAFGFGILPTDPNDGPAFTSLDLGVSLPQPIIRSVRIIGGSPGFPNSVFLDNVTVMTPVPEPATFAALGLGAIALLRRRRGL